MHLKDLVTTLDQMTDDQLIEHLREIRHKKSQQVPQKVAKAEKAATKVAKRRMSNLEALLATLSPAEREALMTQLGEGE